MQDSFSSLKQELQAGHPVTTQTKGVSMQPLLYEGKTVAVIMPLSGPLKRGDVPLYQRANGELVLHRVIHVRNGDYAIRGDNCYDLEPVCPEQLLGVMTEVVRNGKTIHVTDFGYRCYWKIWLFSYPVRYVWSWVRRGVKYAGKLLHRKEALR